VKTKTTKTKFNQKMKTKLFYSQCLAVTVAAFGSQLIGVSTSSAQDLYHVSLNAIGISTNLDGKLVYKELDNRDLIRETASAQGLTNLTGLSLVYNLEGSDVEVVSGTNNTVLGTPLTFGGGVSLNNTNGTEGQVLEYVYWDTNSTASGTLAAGEWYRYGSTNQITDFSLQGQLQFAVPDNGTNGPSIYLGNIDVNGKFAPLPPVGPIQPVSPFGWR
jgi:hypothetical protein